MSAGPLTGLRVLELGGIGPAPFAGMWLADMGAEVVRVDRGVAAPVPVDAGEDLLNRGKRSIQLDLKNTDDVHLLLSRVSSTDILIEGFRPGVAERLGLGPGACFERNPRLVYGRMTGWGQSGPLADKAGHDINYIALSGALGSIGSAERPEIPLNLLGDYGGGATYLVVGVLAALHHANATGVGQVVDAGIVDGVAHLLAGTYGMLNSDAWNDGRASNALDGGAPFYTVYETKDEAFLAVGALEPKFYAALLAGLGLELDPVRQYERDTWEETRRLMASAIAKRTRAEWEDVFSDLDACVTPVLGLREAASDNHLAQRSTLTVEGGRVHPSPAPRFSASPSAVRRPPAKPGEHTQELLEEWARDIHPEGSRIGGS